MGMRALLVAMVLAAPLVLASGEPDVEAMMAGLLARGATSGPAAPGTLDLITGPSDVGYGVRTENYPCYVAILLNVFEVTTDGIPRDGIMVDRNVVAPEPDVPCGNGFESWIGEAHARVAPDAWDWTVCTAFEGGAGGWALISGPCHVADFSETTISGRVGTMRLVDCSGNVCVTLQQVFGGTNNAPGYADVASVRIV